MIARGLAAEARLLVLDEPTASLTEEEIDHLHDVLRRLRDQGVAIVYVTHRLEEIFAVTDDVAVMRDGRTVSQRRRPSVDRGQLIEHITGTRRAGRRRRRRGPAADADELLRVEGLTRPASSRTASFALRAGEVLGIAGLVGAGRTELGAADLRRRPSAAGPRARPRAAGRGSAGPATRMRAGIVLLPEDRRNQGTVRRSPCARTSPCRRSRASARAPLPVPEPGREREARARPHRAPRRSRWPTPRARCGPLGREPAEGRARQVARVEGASASSSTSPPTASTWSGKEEVYALIDELADSGQGRGLHLVGVPRARRHVQPRARMREGRLVGELEGDAVTESALVERCYAA